MSSRFNSPKALHKTPGVCHSIRATAEAIIPPPPTTEFPLILHFNVKWTGDIGFGSEIFEGFNVIAERTPPSNIFIPVIFNTPLRSLSGLVQWQPFPTNLEVQWVAVNKLTSQRSRVRASIFLGENFRPVIINDQLLIVVENANIGGTTDIWT